VRNTVYVDHGTSTTAEAAPIKSGRSSMPAA
jgi:hypothetical protein